jgi:hypothetical protein
MKTKSTKITLLFILLLFILTGFSSIFAQEVKPDKSTTDAPRAINEYIWKFNVNGEEKIVINHGNFPSVDGEFVSVKLVQEGKSDKPSDREALLKNIKDSFLNWSQKGEFEKQADYEERIQKQSQNKFTEICVEEIKKRAKSFRSSDLNINLLTYDAENEFFPTVFKFNGREWTNQVKISIDKAQYFREEEWRNFNWQKEKSSWCFIDNDLFPSIIYLESNSFDITFKLPLPNQEEVTVAFNDLEIKNTHLKDFIFYYSKEMEKVNNIYSPDGVPSARVNYSTGVGLDGDGSYQIGGRRALNKKIIVQKCNQEGIVVVDIVVDRNGNVTKAIPGVRGTTNNSKCLLDPARQAAIETKFNSDPKAPESQMGRIIYRFSLSE